MYSKVLKVNKIIQPDTVYNFGVADNNNYFADGVLTHNCHGGSANAFAKFLNSLETKYRLGLSATPTRKDGRHFVSIAILGRVTVRSTVTAFKPQLETVEMGIKSSHRSWAGINKFIAEDVTLNEQLVNHIIRDFKAGHECIIIPVNYVRHLKLLVDLIEKKVEAKRGLLLRKYGVKLPKQVVFPFWRGVKDRKGTLKAIDKHPFRVFVAIRKMCRQGLDLSRPTMLYNIIPIANKEMFYQLSCRVCTPRENKRQPQVKMFLFNNGWSYGCYGSIMRKEILPKLHSVKRDGRYLMSKVEQQKTADLLNMRDYEDGGSKTTSRAAKEKRQNATPWGGGG